LYCVRLYWGIIYNNTRAAEFHILASTISVIFRKKTSLYLIKYFLPLDKGSDSILFIFHKRLEFYLLSEKLLCKKVYESLNS